MAKCRQKEGGRGSGGRAPRGGRGGRFTLHVHAAVDLDVGAHVVALRPPRRERRKQAEKRPSAKQHRLRQWRSRRARNVAAGRRSAVGAPRAKTHNTATKQGGGERVAVGSAHGPLMCAGPSLPSRAPLI